MSQNIPTIDLTGKNVGDTGTVSWSQQYIAPTTTQQQAGLKQHLLILNESGSGLKIAFPQSGETKTIPAGGWALVALVAAEVSYTYLIDYNLPNPPVKRLLGVYFSAAETPDPTTVLGNSPIGIGAVVASTTRSIAMPVVPRLTTTVAATINSSGTPTQILDLATAQIFNGTQFVTVYLYALYGIQQGYSSGVIVIEALEYNAANTLIASHILCYLVFDATSPTTLGPSAPVYGRFQPLATCTRITMGILVANTYPNAGQAVQPPQFFGTILADIDLTGNIPPPGIGNGSTQNPSIVY